MPRRRDDQLLRAIGARLQQLRGARGLTQAQLAEAMGIEPVSLSRLETGTRALSLSTLAVAADVLEVSLGDLLDVNRALPAPSRSPEESELLRLWHALDATGRDLALRLVREVAAGR